jgi:S-methylmethionine-dependent homocysteine/selenocysteine methylase
MEDLEDWIKMGALIIGGCCGVKPEDIKEIAEEITKMT